ncbi:MAG: hypothetical protein ACI8S6_005372 [Myxococcota bacterium]|jgi:hypothetical protein
MRLLWLLPLATMVTSCKEGTGDGDSAGDRGFAFDHAVQILSPTGGEAVGTELTVTYSVGADVNDWYFELDGAAAEVVSQDKDQRTATLRADHEGRQELRMVGADRQGQQISEHSVKIIVSEQEHWLGITSPSDGAEVYNPVRFAVSASDSVDRIEVYADDWLLGEADSQGLLSYSFTGLGYPRDIDIIGYSGGTEVARDSIEVTIAPSIEPIESEFNDLVMNIIEQYPTNGTYTYYWPAVSDWLGHPNDIYYLDQLYSAGDPQNRSFCVGLTFEVFMRAFEEADAMTGGDGSLNGLSVLDLDDFRVLWFIVNLYGDENVDALEDYGLGEQVTDLNDARPGDIVQFWRNSGSGHNNFFIDWVRNTNGDITGLTYWSTQGSTDGIGYNTEYFGSTGSSIDPGYVFIGRPHMPTDWVPWN